MNSALDHDALIIGSGPNGLAAAIRLAQAGAKVRVVEAMDAIGGGTQTSELTLPGYHHDVCSAIHPLALASPFLSSLPLERFGLEFVQPPIPLAHPLDDGSAVFIHRSIDETARGLGMDGASYRKLLIPLANHWQSLMIDFPGPFPLPPKNPALMARFGLQAISSATGLASSRFDTDRARAVFAGLNGHSILPLDKPASAAFGLMLATLAHGVGWPIVRGGSKHITQAMANYLRSLDGEITTGWRVERLHELPASKAVLFDLTPRGILDIVRPGLAPGYRRQLEAYEYGPGVCKVDWALERPIPWQNPDIGRAGTVHLGGTMSEIAESEKRVWQGHHPSKPFVLLAQQSLFDPSRVPTGRQTAWAYCHVLHGSDRDVSNRIEAQVERFAPGFREAILDRHVYTAAAMENHNSNYVGGDINGGVQSLGQLFTRPAVRWNPYKVPAAGSTDLPAMYICPSATPPGGGVHGMCGFHAAEAALTGL